MRSVALGVALTVGAQSVIAQGRITHARIANARIADAPFARSPITRSPIARPAVDTQIDTTLSFTVVDLHPVRGRTFRDLLLAQLAAARRAGLTPFVELGGTGCGVCHAVRNRLDARPLDATVRAEYAGTYIVRVAIEDWPEATVALGMDSGKGVPAYFAVDTTGHAKGTLHVDYWTMSGMNADGKDPFRTFFSANAWPARSRATR